MTPERAHLDLVESKIFHFKNFGAVESSSVKKNPFILFFLPSSSTRTMHKSVIFILVLAALSPYLNADEHDHIVSLGRLIHFLKKRKTFPCFKTCF